MFCRAGREIAQPWAAVSTGMRVLDTVGCDHLDGRQGKQGAWQLSGKSELDILSHSLHFWLTWSLI